MKRGNLLCHICFTTVLLILTLFPPFYAIDTKSNGKIHTAMGYYPLWNIPKSKDAYYCLVNGNKMNTMVFENKDTANTITQFTANFNSMKFLLNVSAVSIIYLVALLIIKLRRKKTNTQSA